jgi:hypothetical protein
MNALSGFAMRPIDDGQRSELIDGSGQSRARIDGAVLENVYQLEDGYLIVSSDGDAFEECLHLTLCDTAFGPLEVIHIGGAYQTGTFRSCDVGPGPRLRFSFFSDETWQLDVFQKPRWRLHLPRLSVRHEPAFRPRRLWLLRQRT